MRRLLLASAFALAPFAAGAVPMLAISATDDGNPINLGVTCVPTAGGILTCTGSSTDFSSVIITANGVPILSNPDLSAVTITAVRSATAGSHTLGVDVFQAGLASTPATPLQSSFTANDLIGGPFGPETLSTYTGGTIASLGTQLSTVAFPANVNTDSANFTATPGAAFTADAAQILQTFTAPLQEADDSVELQVAAPEPASLALLATGLVGLGIVARRRKLV